MGRRKKTEEKAEAPKRRTRKKAVRAEAETIKKRPAVSVEKMIAENENATIATDYQKYLRKLMRQAGGKA